VLTSITGASPCQLQLTCPAPCHPILSSQCSTFHFSEQVAGEADGGLSSGISVDDDTDDFPTQQYKGGGEGEGEGGGGGRICAGSDGDGDQNGTSPSVAASGAFPGDDGGAGPGGGSGIGRSGLWPPRLAAAGGLWEGLAAPWSRFG
jgi:hypothetical protein